MLKTATCTLGLATSLVLFGCAGSPQRADDADVPTTANSAARAPACPSRTASRIPPTAAQCDAWARAYSNEDGRYYSNEDLSRTGASTAAGALALVDPSVTINH